MLLRPKVVSMNDWSAPMGYAEMSSAVSNFISGKGRYKVQPGVYSRWYGKKGLMTRIDAQMRQLTLGPLLSVQRATDREWVEIQKVSQEPP